MKRGCVLLFVVLGARGANAYDAQTGDTLLELRLSSSEQGLSFGQFLSPRVPVSIVAGGSIDGGDSGASVGSLSMRAGYEGHHEGSAILPRAALEVGMGFDQIRGVGAVLGLRGGGAWYLIRSAGLGFDLGLHRRVGTFRWDAGIILLARF